MFLSTVYHLTTHSSPVISLLHNALNFKAGSYLVDLIISRCTVVTGQGKISWSNHTLVCFYDLVQSSKFPKASDSSAKYTDINKMISNPGI